MIALAEWIGIRRNDAHYLLLARRWARGFVITVAVGVVTGTAIGLQLSLLWPSFMRVAGQSIALPLFMETFAFFFEAIFLGIYLYTWDRFKNKMVHFWLLVPVVIGSSASAFFITVVNAFMNAPAGVTVIDGAITDISPFGAMLSPAMPTKVSHVLILLTRHAPSCLPPLPLFAAQGPQPRLLQKSAEDNDGIRLCFPYRQRSHWRFIR